MEQKNIKSPQQTGKKKTPKTPPSQRKIKANQLSNEQIARILAKKKFCSNRALNVVKEAIDPVEPEKIDFFLSSLKHIDQVYYNDIIVERSITNLCGYPLCSDELGEQPKQQYKISAKTNKVYDITERKNFCSTVCYKASLYLKEQIQTTPLWVRQEDDIIPEFKLLNITSKKSTNTKEKCDDKRNKESVQQKCGQASAESIPSLKCVEFPKTVKQ